MITVEFSSLHVILKSGSPLYRKYLERKAHQERVKADGSQSGHVSHNTSATDQLFDDALFPNGESEDAAMMIKFALLVATRSLGFGHPITKKIDALHDRINGDDLLDVDMLEAPVNEWLKHYTPRYYGTRHEHPALYCQIVGLDLPDFLQGRD